MPSGYSGASSGFPVGLRYREIPPPEDLAGVVACFWILEHGVRPPEPVPLRVLPDGCADLVLSVGPGEGTLEVVGPMTASLVVPHGGGRFSLGVRFSPGGAWGLFREPLDAFRDRMFPLEALWGPRARDLLEEAWACRRGEDALTAVCRRVRESVRAGSVAGDPLMAWALGAGASLSVARLAEAAGCSLRQIERRFAAAVGMPPRLFLAVARFQRFWRSLRRSDSPMAHLALEAGYADQAHAVREFRRFADCSPGAWRGGKSSVAFVQDLLPGKPYPRGASFGEE